VVPVGSAASQAAEDSHQPVWVAQDTAVSAPGAVVHSSVSGAR
jgi:hypothetical protein